MSRYKLMVEINHTDESVNALVSRGQRKPGMPLVRSGSMYTSAGETKCPKKTFSRMANANISGFKSKLLIVGVAPREECAGGVLQMFHCR